MESAMRLEAEHARGREATLRTKLAQVEKQLREAHKAEAFAKEGQTKLEEKLREYTSKLAKLRRQQSTAASERQRAVEAAREELTETGAATLEAQVCCWLMYASMIVECIRSLCIVVVAELCHRAIGRCAREMTRLKCKPNALRSWVAH